MHTKEAHIILMTHDNHGASLTSLNRRYIEEAVSIFGGATLTDTRGYYKSRTGSLMVDAGIRLTIAAEPTPSEVAALERLAERYAAEAGQESVYVLDFHGNVYFAEPNPAVRRAA